MFIGEWSSPPDPSIVMPSSGPLVLYVPLHVDDSLGITNSPSLYAWFLKVLLCRLHIIDLGPCSKFLSILIIRDRPQRRIWLSSHVYISELLDEAAQCLRLLSGRNHRVHTAVCLVTPKETFRQIGRAHV